ncbi:MAG: hypothetical protein ACOC9W_05435 [Persicimonas sp.]
MPACRHSLIALFIAAFLGACASGEVQGQAVTDDGGQDEDAVRHDGGQPDGGQPDGGQPDANPPDADRDTGPDFKAPEFYHSTSGGGLSTSGEHRMQMNFGAPMPRGTSANDEYRIRFGPVSP